jgi:hypothetical protein
VPRPRGARTSGTGKGEDFAELFALYVLDADLLKSLRPDKYAYFAAKFPKSR